MNPALLALSLLCTYGMVGCAYVGYLYTESPMALILYGTLPLTAAVLVLCVCNLVSAFRSGRKSDLPGAARMAAAGLVWKLLAIPYFLLNFLAWTAISAAFLVVPGLQVFLLGLPLAALVTYIPLLTSSAWTLSAIRAARRAGVPVKKRHTVFQLLFVLDTIDALWLYFRLRGAVKNDDAKEENAQ
ncbi:hypothetical protein [Dysosmobacter sp.]|uniref:hypothetical protein n=1 Tax=Dysosmobacter sp. TaxID=2591382 RepID=UPI002A87CF9B|nr:hypothetical protein [Dysosmobacter sp.]MDY3282836.1 hypothetical protein [Dysosmobacter sp.]